MDTTTDSASAVEAPHSELGDLSRFVFHLALAVTMLYLTCCELVAAVFKSRKVQVFEGYGACSNALRPANIPFLMYLCMSVTGILSIAHFLLEAMWYFVQYSAAFVALISASGVAALFGIYFVLWLRQTAFHIHPVVGHLTNVFLKRFSYFEGCVIVIFDVIMCIVIFYYVIEHGCITTCVPDWVPVSSFVMQFQVQISLLILFVWPLWKHRQNLRSGTSNIEQEDLMRVVRRSVVVAVVSICVDVCSIAILLITGFGPILNAMILLNHVCVIFCLVDWKDTFLPCSAKQRRGEVESGDQS